MPAIPPQPVFQKTSGLAITGFVLSFVCGVLGLIFSLIGYSEVKKSKGRLNGQGFALAGIIISLVSIVGAILLWVAVMRVSSAIDESMDQIWVRGDLRRMATSAKQHLYEHGTFPMFDNAPRGSCCSERFERCSPDWSSPAWKAINFDDVGGSAQRLGYRSTPTSFEAIAVVDSDCDGDEVTYTLRVDARDGTPTTGEVVVTGTD